MSFFRNARYINFADGISTEAMKQEIDPNSTKRAIAFQLWTKSPMPRWTVARPPVFWKRFKTPLIRYKRNSFRPMRSPEVRSRLHAIAQSLIHLLPVFISNLNGRMLGRAAPSLNHAEISPSLRTLILCVSFYTKLPPSFHPCQVHFS